jgi:hypothetical protein
MTKNSLVQEDLYDTEWMNEEGEMRDSVMNSQELAAGLLFLLKEYYIGSFRMDGNEVVVAFNNGQRFTVTVEQSA